MRINTITCKSEPQNSAGIVQRGELGETEAAEGKELFVLEKRGWRQGREYRKSTLSPKVAEKKRKSGLKNKKKEKGERNCKELNKKGEK